MQRESTITILHVGEARFNFLAEHATRCKVGSTIGSTTVQRSVVVVILGQQLVSLVLHPTGQLLVRRVTLAIIDRLAVSSASRTSAARA